MKKDVEIGIILGLNIAVERLFKKVCDHMHTEVLCKHELLPALSDDIDTITEIITEQRGHIEALATDIIYKDAEEDKHE